MDNDQTPINGEPKRQGKLPAAARGAALGFEESVLWPLEDGVKSVFEIARWPFERVGWALQRSLIWPLEDRFAELGGRGRSLTAGGGVAVLAVGVAGLIVVTSGGAGNSEPAPVAVAPAPAAKVSAPPVVKVKPAPTLQGAAPVFKPAKANGDSGVDKAKAIESAPTGSAATSSTSSSSSPAATGTISSRPSSGGGAEISTLDGPAAGKKAIAVARDFSAAFVVFETGGDESEVREAFAATATPELAKSLLKRPPRLPANVKVPRAKVVNVVAGPSNGGVYTLSVSLLRVGVTSELRLEMEKLKGEGWRVTNVLG
jgi:hypothetical protein